MKMKCTPVGRRSEILASDDFQAVPVVIAGETPVRAGMPVTDSGAAVPAGTGAAGILLYDADPAVNPHAAMVVQGVVDWSRCRENGASAGAAAMSAILPGIVFRENVGVTKAAGGDGDAGSGGDAGSDAGSEK